MVAFVWLEVHVVALYPRRVRPSTSVDWHRVSELPMQLAGYSCAHPRAGGGFAARQPVRLAASAERKTPNGYLITSRRARPIQN